jgi:hypothetical protein
MRWVRYGKESDVSWVCGGVGQRTVQGRREKGVKEENREGEDCRRVFGLRIVWCIDQTAKGSKTIERGEMLEKERKVV